MQGDRNGILPYFDGRRLHVNDARFKGWWLARFEQIRDIHGPVLPGKVQALCPGRFRAGSWDTAYEFCPEVLVIEAEPTGYPRAPVSKKRVWLDMRNMAYVSYMTFDRKNEMWKSFEAGFSQYKKGDLVFPDHRGNPVWGPNYVHSHDVQSGRMSRIAVAEKLSDGFQSKNDMPDTYEKYLTVQAIRRLGV